MRFILFPVVGAAIARQNPDGQGFKGGDFRCVVWKIIPVLDRPDRWADRYASNPMFFSSHTQSFNPCR